MPCIHDEPCSIHVKVRKKSRLLMTEEPEVGEAAKAGILKCQSPCELAQYCRIERTRALTCESVCSGHRRRLKGYAVRCRILATPGVCCGCLCGCSWTVLYVCVCRSCSHTRIHSLNHPPTPPLLLPGVLAPGFLIRIPPALSVARSVAH